MKLKNSVIFDDQRFSSQGELHKSHVPVSHSLCAKSIHSSGLLRHELHIPISHSPSTFPAFTSRSLIPLPQQAHCHVPKSQLRSPPKSHIVPPLNYKEVLRLQILFSSSHLLIALYSLSQLSEIPMVYQT